MGYTDCWTVPRHFLGRHPEGSRRLDWPRPTRDRWRLVGVFRDKAFPHPLAAGKAALPGLPLNFYFGKALANPAANATEATADPASHDEEVKKKKGLFSRIFGGGGSKPAPKNSSTPDTSQNPAKPKDPHPNQ